MNKERCIVGNLIAGPFFGAVAIYFCGVKPIKTKQK